MPQSALPHAESLRGDITVPLTYNPHDGLVGILSVYKCKSKGSENFIPCPVSPTD